MSATHVSLTARLRQWVVRKSPDVDLLRRFVESRDEAAFAALVETHGSLVLGVARRVTGDYHTAEDVFQATFLTLARRAASLRNPSALPAWLHHTAYHLACMAIRAQRRRDRIEGQAAPRATRDPLDDLSARELLAILDEELRHLPEVFRLPLILCCLEGRSQDEVATLLGWTPGSVKGRLERGRQRSRVSRSKRPFQKGSRALRRKPALCDALRGAPRGVPDAAALGQ